MKQLLIAAVLISTNALAWGPTGHRAVGDIAEDLLSPKVRLKVKEILSGEGLAKVSTWPDEIKSEPETYRHTFNWHYTDWPEDMHEHNEAGSAGTLMGSIDEQLKMAKDEKAPKEKRAFALKFLVHLIGDLHMPLHVGNGLDAGGNNCKVIFHKNPTNLHALWDEGMIDFSKLSYTELSKYVREGVKKQDVQSWMSGKPVDWALESKKIRATIYPDDVVTTAEPLSVKHYCRKDVTPTEAEMPKLGYEYSYKFLPVVHKRIYQAGVRLSWLLNQNL